MGDYFQHWLDMGDRLGAKAPRIFYVNWFRKSAEGKWLWPGFGENSRVLKWMCERVDGKVGARETPIGLLPQGGRPRPDRACHPGRRTSRSCCGSTLPAWKAEVPDIEKHFAQFGDRLPARLSAQLKLLVQRLG